MSGAELLKNEELLLTALSGGSELYGLQIVEIIKQATDGEVIINFGSLYPLLNKLEKKGYVESRWEEANSRKGTRRRYYRVTAAGIELVQQSQALRERLKQLAVNPAIMDSDSISLKVKVFEFEVVTVNNRGQIIKTESHSAKYFQEDLGDGITMDMVAIPPGTFWMGTEDAEIERLVYKFGWEKFRTERPRHQVNVSEFYLGKYPVTQKQWEAVAKLPKISRDLNPKPAKFSGDNLPVERVSWHDAVEFCARLSKHSGKEYRLPSDAEWEYACRAGTTTSFYFGETITSELANYDASKIYADEKGGEYRQTTTEVGNFPPNVFGLYDMHGNVWEWCGDGWHNNYNYQDAPQDGSVWVENNRSISVIRGGSWDDFPSNCRSAARDFNDAEYDYYIVGFRVVCEVPKT